MDIITAHKFSSKHRGSILKSKNCGCFYCLQIFSPGEITDWCDEDENMVGQTAICPKCGIDSLIGDFDLNFDKQFLTEMNKHWF
ncbi:MAG: hypothetical protein DDT31_01524 [Syntrophomonadaceae bacterium]|nr:hypothetical protein [Bacillota bacterium]MBT9149436.1 hypothetical protein [Chloroflexota bacterium]